MSLRMKPMQATDDFSLEVTACFTHFLNEARRVPSANSTHETAWSVLKIALFEAGLEPTIRLEMLKEDASRTYAGSRARAKKHAAPLDMPSSPMVSAAQSVPSTVSPNQMETQIHQLNEAIRDLRHSLHSPKASSAVVSSTAITPLSGTKSGSAKRPARNVPTSGKKPRRDPSTPPSSHVGHQKPTFTPGSAKPRLGPYQSPFCKDRTRNHATEYWQALQSFLRQQRAGKFDSIASK